MPSPGPELSAMPIVGRATRSAPATEEVTPRDRSRKSRRRTDSAAAGRIGCPSQFGMGWSAGWPGRAGGDEYAQVRAEFFLPHSDGAAPKAEAGACIAASQLRTASRFRPRCRWRVRSKSRGGLGLGQRGWGQKNAPRFSCPATSKPMKNQVGQAPGFLPYSDATSAGDCGKPRAIAGDLADVRAGAPTRFGLAFGSFGL